MSIGLEAFAPLRHEAANVNEDRNRRRSIFLGNPDGFNVTLHPDISNYMRGNEDPSIATFTAGFRKEMNEGFPALKKTIEHAMLNNGNGMAPMDASFHGTRCEDFKVVTTEFPLYHPFALFSKNKNKAQHKFFVTQGDMVGLAKFVKAGQNPKFAVVLVEHKTLMELKSPWTRIVDTRTSEQNLMNAHLFRMQTGVKVDCVAWMYHSRRTVPRRNRPPEPVLGVAALRVPQRSAMESEHEKKCFKIFRKAAGRMKWQKSSDNSVLYFDGRLLGAFRFGIPGETRNADPTLSSAFPLLRATPVDPAMERAEIAPNIDLGAADEPNLVSSENVTLGKTENMWRDVASPLAILENKTRVYRLEKAPEAFGEGVCVLFFGEKPRFVRRPLQRQGVAGGFRTAPPGFNLNQRLPPPANEAMHTRVLRRDLFLFLEQEATRLRDEMNLMPRMATYQQLERLWHHLTLLESFRNHVYARFRNGRTRSLTRRMQGASPKPTADDFERRKRTAIRNVIKRALHRHVNETVFWTFMLQSTPPQNAQTSNGFNKEEMGRKFLHQSQRVLWSDGLLRWAREKAAPKAVAAVRFWLASFVP